MRAHEPNEWFVNTPGKRFPGMQENLTTHTPNTWELKPHIGMVMSLPQGFLCSCSNTEKELQQPEVFKFALPLVVPVTPGRCWCKTLPRQMPLVLEMAGNSFFSQTFNFKNNKPTNKNLPQRNFCKA